ncbi:tetraacyldisaccharide 4'-kinase [Kamptonema cortianum]|nr:tetraacyldisaccharide 4'-kinase [Geitlerinema splendidum]MDK3157581.1 tetraacyldisaccharide 4'-kinase [Kamptonema cortianum]
MRQLVERMWEKGGLMAWLLSPLSALYMLGWWTYQLLYITGIKKAKKPHSPIVCVGNLTAGGSGKTPVTIALAQALYDRGYKVVLGLSGYGSPSSESASIAPTGTLSAAEWGDEPALVRLKLPHVPLIVGRNRVMAAELASQNFSDHILLMDDGYQHLPLDTDVRILVDPPLNNRFCFPAGSFREPNWTGKRRAHKLLRYGQEVQGRIVRIYDREGNDVYPPFEATALCAIGSPTRFFDSLRLFGVQVRSEKIMTDHDPLQAGTLLSDLPGELPVVVTEKDYVKLLSRPDLERRTIFVADYRVEFCDGGNIVDWLEQRLNGLN